MRIRNVAYDVAQLRRGAGRQLAEERAAVVVHLKCTGAYQILVHCARQSQLDHATQQGYAPVLPRNQAAAQVCSFDACRLFRKSGLRSPSAGNSVSPPSVTAIAAVDAKLTARASSAFPGAARGTV